MNAVKFRLNKDASNYKNIAIEPFIPAICELVRNLADLSYQQIEAAGQNGRIGISDLQRRIEEYGCRILPCRSGLLRLRRFIR